MNWFYLVFLDSKGVTTGPHPAPLILSKYHFKTGEITALTKIWNVGRGVKQWTELKNVYSLLVDDIVGSIPRGAITKRLLFTMMNPYHIYIYKTKQYPHNSFPVGQAKVNIEYKAYLANLLEHESHAKPLKHFLQNRESVVLGAKKNPFGLDMALFKIREGEQCSVYIPWRLAYGDKGAMNLIPPKTDILFVVTLHKIEKQGTTWQHNKIRLDKWSKMRAKWNAQKASTNTLHITDNYPMPSIQNKPNTPIHNTTNNNMNQAILPIQMKQKPGKPAPRINMQAEAMQKHRSIEDQWKELDHSPHSQPNTPIVVNAQQTFKKPEPASKKRGAKRPSKKLQVNTIHMYSDQFNIPPPPVRKHQSSQSENVAMEEIAAQINAQQSSHQRQMTSYTPTPSKSSEQVRPTLMLSFTQAKEAACAPALMTLTEEEKLPEQEPMFNNNSQSWNSTIVHNPSNENNGGITNDQLRVVRSRKRTQSAMDFGQWLTDNKIRKSVHVALNSTMDTWLSHVNTQKAIFEHQLSAIIANKYNQIFYKHFVQQMALVFYDAKLIRSQFVQEMNGAVLRKDGEKVLFDVPLTVHLLSVIRNKGSAKDMVYDILCLDHFTRNMLEFEADVTYNDALRFCCLIAIHLCKSKVVQNMIKLSKQSGRDIQQITHNLKQKATLLTENLMCLIATGYALLIVNVAQRNNNYEWDVCIECLANLCLSHPMLANANRRTIAADQVKQAVNKESLNMILMAIATDELKQVISDYFNHFGTVEFIDKIIDASRLHNDTL
eukprot:1118247_1